MKKQVEKVLNEIRPQIQMDGGDLRLVSIDEKTGIVEIELMGACVGCPMSTVTLKMGIEETLKKEVPGVTEVVAI